MNIPEKAREYCCINIKEKFHYVTDYIFPSIDFMDVLLRTDTGTVYNSIVKQRIQRYVSKKLCKTKLNTKIKQIQKFSTDQLHLEDQHA